MASGKFTEYDAILETSRRQYDLSVGKRLIARLKIPRPFRIVALVVIILALGILFGLLFQHGQPAPPSHPVWKTFPLSR